MKILLDACIPQDLRHELLEHDVQTARFAGLHELTDSALLDAMEGRFDTRRRRRCLMPTGGTC